MKALSKILLLFFVFSLALSCRNEEGDNRPKIENIEFEVDLKKSYEGDTAKIAVFAEPAEAKAYDKIEYWVSGNDIIEILPESDNDAVVFRGKKAGSAVIQAKVNGISVYCDVKVISAGGNIIPYIILSDYVIESEKGERQHIVASLVGGSPADESGFTFIYTGQDKNIISLVQNNNIGVIETVNAGQSVVTISHPKAQFPVNTLVFVKEKGEIPVYITTDDNVINLRVNDSVREYAVNLMDKNNNDYHLFRHELLDGNGVIDLTSSSNIGTITPKAKGIARIKVSHSGADHPVEIVVIVSEEVEYKYIDVSSSLIIMNEGEFRMISADIVGSVPQDYIYKYDFFNGNDSVIDINSSGYTLSIRALKKGSSVIKIKNDYVDFDREVLVIVNGPESLIDQEKYITTNQNVITTEVNGEVQLTMTLVGGNSADANNFIWTVEDGSIIEVTNQHGTVRYNTRAMISSVDEKFEAAALIKAKKIGTTTITLEHPKAMNSFQVVVKVYKQGVFGVIPVVIDGPGIYQIEKGQDIGAYLRVVAGLEKSLTNVRWESENTDIFSVAGNTNLTGVLRGVGEGITTLTVTGDNLKYDYTATVIVGGDDYLNEKPYIYVNNPYVSVIKGKSLFFKVQCVNVEIKDIENLSIINNSGDKMEMFAYCNNITVTGLELGEGEIIIGGEGLNTLKVTVMVEDYPLTPETPYYLRPEKFIYGMVKGRGIEIPVDLVGGIASNEKDIVWRIEDSNVAEIRGNGKKCIVTGKEEGQTVLTVSHNKSNNNVQIVIYVALSDAELKSRVIIHVPEQNILLRHGESRFISIITNAEEGQNDFRWGTSNANVAAVRPSGDKVKAYIDAVSAGNAKVTVGYANQVPVVIYVSVISAGYDKAYINAPSIVEMVAGQTVNVNAVTSNVYNKYEISWASADENIAKAYGNGSMCTLTAVRSGKTIIEVRYPGFAKDIVLRVYSSNEEMASAYVFAGEQSRYTINEGDIINIGLVFGIKGYPEHDIVNIRWTASTGSIIQVNGNGAGASVKGLAAGIGVVSAADNYGNNIKIEVVVQSIGKAGKYYFSINNSDRIKGMLAGSYADIEVKVFNGSTEIYNIGGIDYKVENSDIIRVEPNDGGIRVYALAGKEGQSFITLKHDLAEDGKILIYTSMTEGGLVNTYPVMVEKSNYLVEKGANFTVLVQTLNEDSGRLRNISYDLEKHNGVVFIQERNKKEIMVSAEKEGSEIILIRYNAEIVQRVYVSVVERGFGLNSGYMVTESIIGLVKGQEYETRVDTDNDWGIVWSSEKDHICKVVEVEGKTAVLRANWQGETIITVKRGDIERYIYVFVTETERELDRYQAVNIEQRSYKLRKGDNMSVNIHSFQGKVEGNTEFEDYYRYDAPYGNVVSVNKIDNGKLNIKGSNEGVAAIRVINRYYNSEIVIYIEVYPFAEGGVNANIKDHYMTIGKNLYVIGPEDDNVYMQVSVSSDIFYGDAYWVWGGYDKNIISVDALGRGAVVNAKEKGQTRIIVANKECFNTIEITVIVGERFVSDGGSTPYIYAEKDLFEAVKGSNISIPYSIMNVKNIVLKNITHQLYNDNINIKHDVNAGVFNVQAVKAGIARFDIKYGDLRREIYVLVKENINAGNIYLTTSENFVAASIGELRNISIDLKGYDEIDNSKFKWSVSAGSPKNVVQLVGNGLVGQIYGVSEGSVVINIEHTRNDEFKAAYPLSINVKIVKDKAREKIVYLTTQRNVIETVEGSQSEMIYVQKVGGDVTRTYTTWTVSNKNVADVDEVNGYSARLNFHGAGSAEIVVKNIEADYALKIVVVVRESTGSNIYISSANSLLWLTPGEKSYRISANLVNGEAKDYSLFVWKIQSQVPSDPNILEAGGKVISIVSSNGQCFIDTINNGVAHIEVTNIKSDPKLVITVYVSHYKEIKFSVSQKSIVKDEIDIVELNLPAYERMKDKARVWAEDLNGGITNAVDVYYTNSLVMLHARKMGHAVVKAAVEGKEGYAQMTVSVLERHDPNVNRVVIGKNLHVLSTRSGPVALNAAVTGPNIYDSDFENIKWEITGNYAESDTEKRKPLADIIPKNISPTAARGRAVQLTPLNEGNAVLRVSHPNVTEEYCKNIFVVIAEMNNRFTVDKKEVTVNTARAETVSCNIVGGTTRDYEEVKWVAKMQQKWDGTLLEVVRIMGSGREVILWPINNGETEVYAFYNGYMETVKVNVVSDYYFSMKNTNEFMYPGETRDLYFDITPASNTVNWMYTPDAATGPVVSYVEINGSGMGGSAGVNRFLRVTALKEGNASIIGMPLNGLPATVNIIVNYDYEFALGKNTFYPAPVWNEYNPEPKFEITDADGNIKRSSTGVLELSYTIYPANTYIKCVTNPIPRGLAVEISNPVTEYDSKGRAVGRGIIKFTGLVEMNSLITFQQYKAAESGAEEVMVTSTEARPSSRAARVMYYFNYSKTEPILEPFFVRGEGKFSNQSNYNNYSEPKWGEQKYWMRNGKKVPGGEEIFHAYVGSNRGMTLGDGEVHYILFDKKYESASANITKIEIEGGGSASSPSDGEITIADGYNDNNAFTAAIVDFTLDNETYKAVRLSGGNDYIEYNRVAFDKELFIEVRSAYVNGYNIQYENLGAQITVEDTVDAYEYSVGTGFTGDLYATLRGAYANKFIRQETQTRGGSGGSYTAYIVYSYQPVVNIPYNTTNGTAVRIRDNIKVYRYDKSRLDTIASSEHPFVYRNSNLYMISSSSIGNAGSSSADFRGNVSTTFTPRDTNSYYYSEYNYSIPTERPSNYNVFKGKYISANGSELSGPPSDAVYIGGLQAMPSETYSSSVLYQKTYTERDKHTPSGFFAINYGNMKYPEGQNSPYPAAISNQKTYGYGSSSGNSSITGGVVGISLGSVIGSTGGVYKNTESFNIFAGDGNYSRYYHPCLDAYSRHDGNTTNGGCQNNGWHCDGYYVYSQSHARQRYTWKNNRKVIVPYYIFNRFPYRYENNSGYTVNNERVPNEQFVKITEGGGKPMPSLNRTPVASPVFKTLKITYEVFNPFIEGGKESKHIDIPINCVTRKSHSWYVDYPWVTDGVISYDNQYAELEGPITSFYDKDNKVNDLKNIDIGKYFMVE